MKAAFFDFNLSYGGASAGTISLAERLSNEMEIHIIDAYGQCAEYGKRVIKAGLRYQVLHPKARRHYIGNNDRPAKRLLAAALQLNDFARIRMRLVETIRNMRPDLVWVNNEKSLAFVLGPFFRARMPIALYYRGWGTPDQIGPFFRFLLKCRTDGVIVHSPLIAKRFISYGIPRDKVYAIPNAVGLNDRVEELRKRAVDLPGVDRKLKILLPAARPVRDKGLDVAVLALRRLKDRGEDAVLWMTGILPPGVGHGFVEELRSLVSYLGLEKDVHFLGWRADLQAVIARSDIVILPSRTEGFPRVIAEAMLIGVPVCATPVGGVPDAIIDGKTGFLIGVGNDELLAARISMLASDVALRSRITGSALTLAREMFSLDEQTKAVSDLFNLIVESKKNPIV